MLQKHYSDDVLLACRDGELSGRARSAVEKHLELCWLCRSRQAELEDQIRAVADVFREQDFPGPGWIEQSKRRFHQLREQFERNSPQFRGLTPLFRSSVYRMAVAASIAIICLAVLISWSLWWRTAPSPVDIVAKSQAAEREVRSQALCQVFRVEIAQIKPSVLREESRLTVWSEKDGQRFASRWEVNGALKHGAWRPDDRRYIYNPAVDSQLVPSNGVAKPVSISELADQRLEFQQMEAAFVRWLESHQWRPISLTSDISVFTSQRGVKLTAERTRSWDGKEVLQLVARREMAGSAVELTVQVDPLNYLPRLERIRFEAPGRAAEFGLSVDRIQAIRPAQLAAALFEPDIHIGASERGGRPGMPSGPQAPPFNETRGPILTASEETGREVEVQYVLHRVGACLGEQIDVVKRPSGRILVRGLVENEQRKAQLSAALRTLPFVEVEVKSLSEALENPPRRSPATAQSTEITVAGSTLPIEGLLKDYFKQRYEPAQVSRQIAELANGVTSLSASVLTEAWAIRRLAMEFPASRADGLSGAPRWLLEKMFQDHTSALRKKGNHFRQRLQGVFSGPLAGDQEMSASEPSVAADWSSAAGGLLTAAERIDRLARALFAGAALPEGNPEAAMRELMDISSHLDGRIRNFESAVVAQFSDPSGRLPSSKRPKGLAAAESKKGRKL